MHLDEALKPILESWQMAEFFLDNFLKNVLQVSFLYEVLALLVCWGTAFFFTSLSKKSLQIKHSQTILFGKNKSDGLFLPFIFLLLAFIFQFLLGKLVPLMLFNIAIPFLYTFLILRLITKVFEAAFSESVFIRSLIRIISSVGWVAVLLWVSGFLPLLMIESEKITFHLGGNLVSLRAVIEGSLTACTLLILSLWLSATIERRLLGNAKGNELSLRKAFSNALRAILMFVGLLFSLTAVGIDLSALSVFGGAIGVGVGFGLQKLAANYVSGFVILAERSLRIGDSIRVENFEGQITEINARYTVVRSLGGRESIVPNEHLITNRVENLSLADPLVWQSASVSVGYDSDVVLVMRLLYEAAIAQDRDRKSVV